jgi:hypothetical protein
MQLNIDWKKINPVGWSPRTLDVSESLTPTPKSYPPPAFPRLVELDGELG